MSDIGDGMKRSLWCPGCGEMVPHDQAYRDGPQPFHYNDEGGGHTMRREYYGPHVLINEESGVMAACGGLGWCRICDDTPIPYTLNVVAD